MLLSVPITDESAGGDLMEFEDFFGDLAGDLGGFCALDFLSNLSRFALSLIFLEFRRSARGDFSDFPMRSGLEERFAFNLEDGRLLLGIREDMDPRDDVLDLVDLEDLVDSEDLAMDDAEALDEGLDDILGFDLRRDEPVASVDDEDFEDEVDDFDDSLGFDFRRWALFVFDSDGAVEVAAADILETDFFFFRASAFGFDRGLPSSLDTDFRFFLTLSLGDD